MPPSFPSQPPASPPFPHSPIPPLPARWLALGLLGGLALAAGWVALVLASGSWADARALDELFPYYDWHIRPFGPAGWARQQQLSGGLALALGVAWLGLGPLSGAGRRSLAALGPELRQLAGQLRGQWRSLRRGQRQFFLGQLLVLTAGRLYLSLTQHWADDAVSFEFFVRQRLLAVAAYYPLPNNHVGSNALAWLFYQLHPTFWWSMRLPVLLTATAGTLLLFAGLWRRLGYWPALLAAGAMSWVQLSLYHAAAGRGYWLVVLGAALVFFGLLGLLAAEEDGASARPDAGDAAPRRPHLAWLALVAGSLLGSYAVPTFAYVLASAFSWLGLQAVLTRRWPLLAGTLAAGAAVAAGVLLLYWPVLYVSGPAALLHNAYVEQLPVAAFWRQLPAHAWLTEGYLLGQCHVGALGTLLGLALWARAWQRARAGQLPGRLAVSVRQVGLPALWFLGVPYAVLTVQRVLPPERTWLYKSWFFFVVLALGLAAWPALWQTRRRRRLLGVGVALFGLYQVAGQLRTNHYAWALTADRQATYDWLRQHPAARPVLVPDLYLWAWLRFATHVNEPARPWTTELVARPGVPYAYVIVWRGTPEPAGATGVAFEAGQVQVYRLRLPAPLRSLSPPPTGGLFWERPPR